MEKKAKKHNSKVIQKILDEITPIEMERTKIKMTIAAKMDDRMKEIGINKIGFAMRLAKSPSEITKWLSGTQNLTIETLVDIAHALETNIDYFFSKQNPYGHTIPFQCCPVCNGTGQTLADGFIANMFQECKVCNGKRIIPMYYVCYQNIVK